MSEKISSQPRPEPTPSAEISRRRTYYADVLKTLESVGTEYGIIGGVGQRFYGGGRKATIDLDIAVAPADVGRVLEAIAGSDRGWRIEYKHPEWLNQVWSGTGIEKPAFSVDLIHRHSSGLAEVKPWWFEMGQRGEVYGGEFKFAAPEAIALTKVILWSRRQRDMIDAVQVVQESQEQRPFEWNKLLDELHADWRLGYTLAVLTDLLYGSQTRPVDEAVRQRLHRSLTSSPIPSPVRGHIFAYDIGGDQAGHEQTWRDGRNALTSPHPEEKIVSILKKWPTDQTAMVTAARTYMGSPSTVDLQALAADKKTGWRRALGLILYTETLYGETGSAAIPPEARQKISERFLDPEPTRGLGEELFPERF